ncbi:hypothetical protein K437DRAFT_247959 [Tilletiaria anomala UBC 951]|uniref:Mitochondrial zinc maintenance protein 1, mitochondrial n=1 Tax=Tilletiaria anomala (strain ATCC 24038 / CBS 436.72 / UBC 951) TaxID=1037660 RepID=A0A066VZ73_TILAU|nr:uncharacterized protein K437DRAFT_247959 [Tilletiaria anomala UBC 951]KDN44119.1 hypothetical protein K437DRAFT_247959 [Tilletiaria anomala UBC 951]
MSLTQAQKVRALSLYRRLLKAGQTTFAGDQRVISAWQDKIKTSFKGPQQLASDGAKAVEAKLQEWEDVIMLLRRNVVQGTMHPETGAYSLRFTADTELGSNESVKQARKQQLESLATSKGPSCRSSQTRAFSHASPAQLLSASSRALDFSTSSRHALPQQRTFSSSRLYAAKASSSSVPSPVPHFPTTMILSDGSSIQMHTTSPRHVTRLTRDVTNHPLWNPASEKRGNGQGDGSEAEVGRLGRFRRRFAEEAIPASLPSSGARSGSAQAADGRFGEEDLAWMSVGGRQARAGTPISKSKAKGKK